MSDIEEAFLEVQEEKDAPAVTFAAWAAQRGLTTTADVDGHIHAGLRSKPQTKTYDRWNGRRLTELQDRRDAAEAAYRAEIADGLIREPTSLERLQATASGHPDNPSVQAARRMLAKRAALAKVEHRS